MKPIEFIYIVFLMFLISAAAVMTDDKKIAAQQARIDHLELQIQALETAGCEVIP